MSKRIIYTLLLLLATMVTSMAANKKFTLVIDAGHGGRDAGCVGAKCKEKNLTLKMALAFGKYVERNCSDVKVIYTRKTDVFLELWQRAEIANRNKADLFISVHINALPGGKIARGFQTYTLGRGRSSGSKKGIYENLEVAKRENAVIVMEKDYRQHYEGFDPNSPESNIMFEFIQDTHMERSVDLAKFMQKHVCAATGRQNGGAHQDNLAVLRLTSMPGCLLELGFISTPDEERFMNSESAPEQYARGFFNAFMAYKRKYAGGVSVPFQQADEPKTSLPSVVPQDIKDEVARKQEIKQSSSVKQKTSGDASKNESSKENTEQKTELPPIMDFIAKAAAAEKENHPIFKVQIIASNKPIKVGSAQFKGLTNIESYKENGLIKYTFGASNDYNEIYRLRKSILDKFPNAFIIAFKKGSKMDVREAIKEFKSNKNR